MKKNYKLITQMLRSDIDVATLSKKSGVNRAYISMIRNGRLNASDEHKKRLAGALNVPVDMIFG